MEITMKTDRCRYTYNHDNGLCESMPLIVKPYTLEELCKVYEDMKAKHRLAKSKYTTAEEAVKQYVMATTLKEIHADATEYNALRDKRDECKKDADTYQLALNGIHGAIRYYQALRLNEAYRAVLPKYAGKQAGPKTKEKFQKEVASYLNNRVRIYHNYMYSVSVYDEVLGLDNTFYANEDLTTRGNQFNQNYCILLPSDAFSGHYPQDWLVWAMHVQNANDHIKEAFDALYNEISGLRTALCIGNTKMFHISVYDLKQQ